MTLEHETLRNIERGVKNYRVDNPDGLLSEHDILERALLHGAKVAGVSHCGVEAVEIDGDFRRPIYYLNLGDLYDTTVMIFFGGGIAGTHRVKIGSVGDLLERASR
jgi:hypothetical protein